MCSRRSIPRRLDSWLRGFFNRRGVRLSLMIGVMSALLWKVDRTKLGESLIRFDPLIGIAMAGVFLLLTGLFALRWWTIGTALGVRAPFKAFVRAVWVSQCVSELGPALVIGELARFQSMRKYGDNWSLVLSQAMDRVSGNAVLLLMVLALTPFYLESFGAFPWGQIGFLILMALGGVSLVVLLVRRFWPIARWHRSAVLAVCDPRISPLHYGISFLLQCLLAVNFSLAALGLRFGSVDAVSLLLLAPLLLLGVGTLPGLVSDWGKREAAAVVLFAPAGLAVEESLAVSLVFGLIHMVMALPGALLLLSSRAGSR